MKNKYTLIGFALIAAILFGWMYFMSPSKEEMAKKQRVQDSLRQVRMEQMALDSLRMMEQQQAAALAQQADSAAMAEMDSTTLATQKANALTEQFGVFASAAEGSEQLLTIENKKQKLTFSNKGGLGSETAWQGTKTTQAIIDYVKAQGFRSIRIPCAWVWGHMADADNYTIDAAWMARVKEIIDCADSINAYNLEHDLSREINETTVKIKSLALSVIE